eukprot:gene12764-26909_t
MVSGPTVPPSGPMAQQLAIPNAGTPVTTAHSWVLIQNEREHHTTTAAVDTDGSKSVRRSSRQTSLVYAAGTPGTQDSHPGG